MIGLQTPQETSSQHGNEHVTGTIWTPRTQANREETSSSAAPGWLGSNAWLLLGAAFALGLLLASVIATESRR